jgi:hypothetical protein
MKNPGAEPDRNDNRPVMDSASSPIVELAGNEDTTVRPLRPGLARWLEKKRAAEGEIPPPTEPLP